jgi:hypothetical protein
MGKLRQQALPGIEILPAHVSFEKCIGKTISAVIEGKYSDVLLVAFDDQSFAVVCAHNDGDPDESFPRFTFGPVCGSFRDVAAINFSEDDLLSVFPKYAVDYFLARREQLQYRPVGESRPVE